MAGKVSLIQLFKAYGVGDDFVLCQKAGSSPVYVVDIGVDGSVVISRFFVNRASESDHIATLFYIAVKTGIVRNLTEDGVAVLPRKERINGLLHLHVGKAGIFTAYVFTNQKIDSGVHRIVVRSVGKKGIDDLCISFP